MDGEFAGAQVAPPPMMFLHRRPYDPQLPPQPPGRKRDSPWPASPAAVQRPLPPAQLPKLMGCALPSPPASSSNWNTDTWQWDSIRFAAEPKSSPAAEEESESLALKLGGVAYEKTTPAEEPVGVSPNKRVRSGSPGNGGGGASYPMCQVDDCRADLSNAKDYHRRHKVCELHSKTTKALVAKQMQRFCQQCSR